MLKKDQLNLVFKVLAPGHHIKVKTSCFHRLSSFVQFQHCTVQMAPKANVKIQTFMSPWEMLALATTLGNSIQIYGCHFFTNKTKIQKPRIQNLAYGNHKEDKLNFTKAIFM